MFFTLPNIIILYRTNVKRRSVVCAKGTITSGFTEEKTVYFPNAYGQNIEKFLTTSDIPDLTELRNEVDQIWDEIDWFYEYTDELAAAISEKADITDIPDVSSFITSSVNDLINYYKKSETYTQSEVNTLINALTTLDIQVVQTLPIEDISTTTIYLLPKSTIEIGNVYDEYIYVSNSWEKIGTTEIDLSNYYTKTQSDGKFLDVSSNQSITGNKSWNDNGVATLVVSKGSSSDGGYVIANKVTSDPSKPIFSTYYKSGKIVNDGKELTLPSAANGTLATIADIPTNTSELTNDSGYLTSHQDISGKQDVLTAGANITISNNTITATDTTYSDATTSTSGLMSSTDKTKLDGISSGAEVNVQANWNETDTSSDAYILNKPTIPTVPTNLSSFTDDLGTSPTHTHSQYLTSHQDISGKEDTSNKVTAIDTASPSSTEYPSESAVVSYVSGLVGGIDTILNTINGEVI